MNVNCINFLLYKEINAFPQSNFSSNSPHSIRKKIQGEIVLTKRVISSFCKLSSSHVEVDNSQFQKLVAKWIIVPNSEKILICFFRSSDLMAANRDT